MESSLALEFEVLLLLASQVMWWFIFQTIFKSFSTWKTYAKCMKLDIKPHKDTPVLGGQSHRVKKHWWWLPKKNLTNIGWSEKIVVTYLFPMWSANERRDKPKLTWKIIEIINVDFNFIKKLFIQIEYHIFCRFFNNRYHMSVDIISFIMWRI